MTDQGVVGIEIRDNGDRVVIEVPGERWEGSAAEAERLLTRLHYVLGRARPGTNIASVFLNDQLWGGKLIETDPSEAVREMRAFVEALSRHLDALEEAARAG